MVLKSTLNGYKIPICRVEDLEITLVSPDLPVKVRLPDREEAVWRSCAELRAAEVQCMQLALALLARHESGVYVTNEEEKNTRNDLESNYNEEQGALHTGQSSRSLRKYREECEKVFGQSRLPKLRSTDDGDDRRPAQSMARQFRNLTLGNKETQRHESTGPSKANTLPRTHTPSERLYRREEKRFVRQEPLANANESSSSQSRTRRTSARQVPQTSAPFAATHSLKPTSNMY